MSWRAQYNSKYSLVHVLIADACRFEDAEQYAMALVQLLTEHETDRVLVECDEISIELTEHEMTALPTRLQEIGLRENHRIAIVLPTNYQQRRAVRSYRTAVHRHGFKHELFVDATTALAWLNENIES
ncbi:MAG: hypothetical protein HYX63_17645 [Gammaproteobacteria bacterium]|nr:hypothetical protein [Gammaproteobacteria bacterium]